MRLETNLLPSAWLVTLHLALTDDLHILHGRSGIDGLLYVRILVTFGNLLIQDVFFSCFIAYRSFVHFFHY